MFPSSLKKKEWAKHWQFGENAQDVENKLWKNDGIRKLEGALPRLKECDLERASRVYKAKTGSRMRRLPP